jgi:hypothetical protein
MLYARRAFLSSSIIILALFFSACIPRPSSTPQTAKEIPANLLTEVSATLIAFLSQTPVGMNTPTVTASSTTGGSAQTLTTTSTLTNAPPTATTLSITTATPIPAVTNTQLPTFTASPPRPIATFTLVPSPTATRPVTPGTHFVIDSVNIPNNCLGPLWVIFAIYNNGTSALESLSLTIHDETAKKVLVLPAINNAPFMSSDKTCAPGTIDTLQSGEVLYIGASLGPTNPSQHTLSATIELCNGEGKGWPCYKRIINFVVP